MVNPGEDVARTAASCLLEAARTLANDPDRLVKMPEWSANLPKDDLVEGVKRAVTGVDLAVGRNFMAALLLLKSDPGIEQKDLALLIKYLALAVADSLEGHAQVQGTGDDPPGPSAVSRRLSDAAAILARGPNRVVRLPRHKRSEALQDYRLVGVWLVVSAVERSLGTSLGTRLIGGHGSVEQKHLALFLGYIAECGRVK